MSLEREVRGAGPLVVAAGIAVVAAVASVVQRGIPEPGLALAFGVFIALGELLRISLPNGRQAAPLATAGALAFSLLPTTDGHPEVMVGVAVTVVTLGSVVGSFPRALVGRGLHIDELARRVLVTLFAAAAFQYGFVLGLSVDPSLRDGRWRLALAMIVVAVLAACLDAALAALVRAAQVHRPLRTALADEFRALVGISSAITATGVLIALATPAMGAFALLVFAVPLLMAQFSFRRYATIDATYLQTIQSLAKVTEVGGYTEKGHSTRVARLSVLVARELGLAERDLDDLRYAALMHDIGQLSLSQPIPGGATTFLAYHDQRRIADLGADVIDQAGLDRAALIVRRQADPYRPQRGRLDDGLPLASRIIKVTNAYDDLVGDSIESTRKQHAVERLGLGVDREYDPDVVDVLARIVDRELAPTY